MDGDFYGTSESGGIAGRGTIYKIKASTGERTILVSFGSDSSQPLPAGTVVGDRPTCRLVQGTDGTLYGTTSQGGTNNDNGTIFSLTMGGVFTTLKEFPNDTFADPQELIFGSDGNLYGSTQGGGTHFGGMVFQLTPGGGFIKLVEFDGQNAPAEGFFPRGPLARDSDGNLYGTCGNGGVMSNGFYNGTIYKVTPQNVKTTLARFTGTDGVAKGKSPTGVRLMSTGLLYGTTFSGGANDAGTIFKCSTTGTFTTVSEFDSVLFDDGPGLDSPPTEGSDGNYYGTAGHAGQPSENGLIYQITPDGVYTNIHLFGGAAEPILTFDANGGEPANGVIMGTDGNLYGATRFGGKGLVTPQGQTDTGFGVIYKVSPLGQRPYTVLAQVESYTGSPLIGHPRGALAVGSDGNLYGTTQEGGALGNGTIFNSTPAGAYTVLAKLTGTGGAAPGIQPGDGLLPGAGTTFYGTVSAGGSAANDGLLFSVTSGGTYTPLITFSGNTAQNGSLAGQLPISLPADDGNGNLFGTTSQGGMNNLGTIFEYDSSQMPHTVHEFAAADGGNPFAGLVLKDGTFYGTTSSGGANGFGTIYSITPGGAFLKVLDFNGQSGPNKGSQPGALTLGPDGNLYGTTFAGGLSGNGSGFGTVFKMDTSGTFTTLAQFTGTTGAAQGAFPQGPLYITADGTVYGTTVGGGANNYGTIFSIKADLTFTTVHAFGGLDGNSPRSGLILGPGGFLYGSTELGGLNGDNGPTAGAGSLFLLDLSGPVLPSATTLSTQDITATTATLRADVNPNGADTTVEFFLNNESFGTVGAGDGLATATVQLPVTGLTDATHYTVRAKATNAAGTTDGGTTEFDTLTPPVTTATVEVSFTAVAHSSIGASPVPGNDGTVMGIPTGATFTSLDQPAIDEAGRLAFLGKFGSPVKSAIFAWNGSTFGPIAVLGTAAPGLAFNYSSLGDPAVGGPASTDAAEFGRTAFMGKISGPRVTPANNTLFVSNATADGSVGILARTGSPLAAMGSLAAFTVSKIGAFVVDGSGSPCAMITLRSGGGVTGTNNIALVRWVAGVPAFVVRKGDKFNLLGKDRSVKLIAALAPATGSAGAARGPAQLPASVPACRVTFTDNTQAIFGGNGSVIAFGGAAGQPDKSYGLPAGGPIPTFLSHLTFVHGSVTAANSVAILGPRAGNLSTLARKGVAPAEFSGFPYSTLFDPVGGEKNGVAFLATFSGSHVTTANNRGLFWVRPDGTTVRMLRVSESIPAIGAVPVASITSIALPPDNSRGPIAVCKLKAGRGGVPAAQAQLLVGRGSYDTVEKLLQAGETLPNGKAIRSMAPLGATIGSLTQGRSYNALGQIVTMVTFTDGSTAIVKCTLP